MFENFTDEDWERAIPSWDYGSEVRSWLRDLVCDDAQVRAQAFEFIRRDTLPRDASHPIMPRLIPILARIIRSDAPADRDNLLQLIIWYAQNAHPVYAPYASLGTDPNALSDVRRKFLQDVTNTYQAILQELDSYVLMLKHSDDEVRIKAFNLLLLCLSGAPSVSESLGGALRDEESKTVFFSMVNALTEFFTEGRENMPAGLYQSCMQNPHAQIKDAPLQKQLRHLSGKLIVS